MFVAHPQVLAVGERRLGEVCRDGRFRIFGRITAKNGDEGLVRQSKAAGFAAQGGKLEPRALVIVGRIENHRPDLERSNK